MEWKTIAEATPEEWQIVVVKLHDLSSDGMLAGDGSEVQSMIVAHYDSGEGDELGAVWWNEDTGNDAPVSDRDWWLAIPHPRHAMQQRHADRSA